MTFISTNKASCLDCHRCIRTCPVKAIGLRDGQCWVVEERCILCGSCLRACPQSAKTVTDSTALVRQLLASERPVVASLAPSFAAVWRDPLQLIAGLRRLGFAAVEETAIAAGTVGREYRQRLDETGEPVISACCPVVVNLVETRYPQLVRYLAPSASPMVTHAADVARRRPGAACVFIGPCVAKMKEALRPEAEGRIAAVLTFDQLLAMFAAEGIDLGTLPREEADLMAGKLATFPLTRGIREAAGFSTLPSGRYLSIDGIDRCLETLADLARGAIRGPVFLEMLACPGGCIGGAGLTIDSGLAAREQAVVAYAGRIKVDDGPVPSPAPVTARFDPVEAAERLPDEAAIRAVLARIGKHSPADERNCGGCGYDTCREKAIAVLQGLAEPEMCIPYMKAKFQTLAHAVVESSLSAVVVVNGSMEIQEFNPAANRMFNPNGLPTVGRPLATFFDPSDFLWVWRHRQRITGKRVAYPHLGLVTRQTIYPLERYEMVVGIITDISEEEALARADEELRRKTAEKAKEVIKNQMRLAQEIAGLLGEATAESKATLVELVDLLTRKEGT